MSTLEESLFCRLCLLWGYVTQEQLDECLAMQSSGKESRPIGHILLELRYLGRDQYRKIMEVQRQKVRKYLRRKEEVVEADREFSELALRSQSLDLKRLEQAVLEQQRLRRLNLHFTLSEVVLSMNHMDLPTVRRILSQQDRLMLRCPVCDLHYRAALYRREAGYRCLRCEGELVQAAYLDSLLADGVVEARFELVEH